MKKVWCVVLWRVKESYHTSVRVMAFNRSDLRSRHQYRQGSAWCLPAHWFNVVTLQCLSIAHSLNIFQTCSTLQRKPAIQKLTAYQTKCTGLTCDSMSRTDHWLCAKGPAHKRNSPKGNSFKCSRVTWGFWCKTDHCPNQNNIFTLAHVYQIILMQISVQCVHWWELRVASSREPQTHKACIILHTHVPGIHSHAWICGKTQPL